VVNQFEPASPESDNALTSKHVEIEQAYANLSPDEVLNSIEKFGLRCDGRLLALNSYENRVYRVGSHPLSLTVKHYLRLALIGCRCSKTAAAAR